MLGAALLASGLTAQAQTANWKGLASGGEWNTQANWDLLDVPGVGTNAQIGLSTNVNYNLPMTAASFGTLTNRGVLNINTNGFNCGMIVMPFPTAVGKLFVNNGGVVNLTGNLAICSNSIASMAAGSSVTVGGSLIIGSSVAGGNGNTLGAFGSFTNNGGILTAAFTSLNPGNQSIATSCRLVINGGTNNLGAYSAQRSPGGASAPPSLGTDGLIISNGQVNATSLSVGNNAHGIIYLVNGTLTNSGTFTIKNATGTRPARFLQTGGLYVSTGTNVIVINPSGGGDTVYSVLGGTNYVGGIQLGVGVNAGTSFFTNSATIYVGSLGMGTNGALTLATLLNTGGRFGASADWTNTSPITLNGGSIDAQDAAGTPFNIFSSGALRGSGPLFKTGGGTLTLDNAHTYSGITYINQGTLALGAAGLLATPQILVASNTVFDVSAVSGGYVLPTGKILHGWGTVTGAVSVASGATVDPGTNNSSLAPGTFTFMSSVTETGGAKNHFDLSSNPSGPNNDVFVINGDLNVSGISNILEISGGGPSGSVHPLFKYTGSFNGDLTNFAIAGPSGVLTNITSSSPKVIAFIAQITVRSSTNITWIGNPGANDWNVLAATNWINNGALDYFVSGDNVTFNATGAANPNVNVAASVSPGSVTVNAATNYSFSGTGSIGTGGITKTNSGRLTILNTNDFTGGVTIYGGTVSVESLADDGTASPLGKSGTLLVDGGTLEYTGPNNTWSRTVTMGVAGGAMSVTNGATVLIQSGTVVGTGSLTKTGTGTLVLNNSLNSYGGGTFINAGTLTILNATAASTGIITMNGGSLTNGAVKPANTINVAQPATISGGNAGGLTGIRNVTGSSNLVIAVTAGVFDLIGDMTAYDGNITFSNAGGAVIRFQGATGSALATWDLGAGPMDLNIRSGSTLNNFGALKGAAGTTLSGRGGASNNGPTTHSIGANGQSTTFDGVIQNGAGGGSSTTAITKVGSGTLTLSGANTYTATTTVSNGVLALTGSGSIATSSSINLIAGAFVDVSGLATPTLALGASQTLKGNGTVNGSLDASGTVSPGASIGKLTVTNIATLLGTTYMELNRTNSVQTNDILAAASIVLGGTLTVTNIGPTLVAGDRFVLFSGPITGSFATVNLPENLGTVTYTWTNKTALDGSIQVLTVTTVNQNPTNIVAVVNGGSLELSWPADHTGWHLQSQTNSLADGLGTNWVTIPGTDTGHSYTNTFDPANGTVFYRMVYP